MYHRWYISLCLKFKNLQNNFTVKERLCWVLQLLLCLSCNLPCGLCSESLISKIIGHKDVYISPRGLIKIAFIECKFFFLK